MRIKFELWVKVEGFDMVNLQSFSPVATDDTGWLVAEMLVRYPRPLRTARREISECRDMRSSPFGAGDAARDARLRGARTSIRNRPGCCRVGPVCSGKRYARWPRTQRGVGLQLNCNIIGVFLVI